MANLSEEIIIEILSRLPITTLCRFRSVSKPWFSLISNPHFIKTHLNRNTIEHDRLILLSNSLDFYSVPLKSSQFNHDSLAALHLKFPPNQYPNHGRWSLRGSCNGLLLMLHNDRSCFLVNPSTRQSRKTPNSPFSKKSTFCYKFYCDSYGLGYDSSNNDYKVVRISHYFCISDCTESNIVSVYAKSTNSWRRIEDYSYPGNPFIFKCPSGIFVSGSLHWLTKDSNNSDVIATFHLADENFQIMPLPTLQYPHRHKFRLGALGGCLCVFVPLSNGCQDVWVMKEYGVRDSWTKITIGYTCSCRWRILCLSRTGQVLFDTRRNKLILFDPQEKYKELVVQSSPTQFEAGTYVESLVSPNCSNMIK